MHGTYNNTCVCNVEVVVASSTVSHDLGLFHLPLGHLEQAQSAKIVSPPILLPVIISKSY